MKGKIVDDRIVWPSNNDNVRCVLKILFSIVCISCFIVESNFVVNKLLYLELS